MSIFFMRYIWKLKASEKQEEKIEMEKMNWNAAWYHAKRERGKRILSFSDEGYIVRDEIVEKMKTRIPQKKYGENDYF